MFVRSLSGWNITIFFDEKLSRRNGPLALSLSPARICCAVAVVLFSAHACVCLARVWVRVRSDHGVWLGGVREATQATAERGQPCQPAAGAGGLTTAARTAG
jgi:hypothetical protein